MNCKQCHYYEPDVQKPAISRCKHGVSHLGEGVYMMAREQRLPGNRCGVDGEFFTPIKK